ncbi:hypothetical protein ACAG39_03230 [Caldicellulosiruptoraceae bacterium PP1]
MPQFTRLFKFIFKYDNFNYAIYIRQLSERKRIKKIEKDLISCYKEYAEINRTLANECIIMEYENLVQYENIINVDFCKEGLLKLKNQNYEGRLAESGESVGTKSNS